MAVDTIVDNRFSISQGSSTLKIPYDGTIDLNETNPDVEKAIVVVHGTSRNADDYLRYILNAAERAGDTDTAVIAPQFLLKEDINEHNLPKDTLYWTNDGWKSGNLSTQGTGQNFKVSSYEVMDEILLSLAEQNPNLNEITIVGHSAGGQFVNRYAAGGTAENEVTSDIDFSYVIANPSSYMYFSEERVIKGTLDEFTKPNVSSRSTYNDYKYGLEDLNSYMSATGEAQLKENYQERNVNILLGLDDDNPNSSDLDKSSAAMLQGNHRLERGIIYFNHIQDEFGASNTPLHDIAFVPNTGHSASRMFRSEEGIDLLFNEEPAAVMADALIA